MREALFGASCVSHATHVRPHDADAGGVSPVQPGCSALLTVFAVCGPDVPGQGVITTAGFNHAGWTVPTCHDGWVEGPTPLAASVFCDFTTGRWILALEGPSTEVIEVVPTGWDGRGRFQDEGLNAVAPLLTARNLAYNTTWTEVDGRYTVAVHRPARWGRA